MNVGFVIAMMVSRVRLANVTRALSPPTLTILVASAVIQTAPTSSAMASEAASAGSVYVTILVKITANFVSVMIQLASEIPKTNFVLEEVNADVEIANAFQDGLEKIVHAKKVKKTAILLTTGKSVLIK